MATNIILKKSSVAGRIPDSADLNYGELAVNYADGKIYYKNSSNEVKSFIDSAAVQTLINNIDVSSSGVDSAAVTALIDSDYVQLHATGLSYNLLTGLPNVLDSADVTAIANSLEGLDSTGVKNLVDSAYIGARITDFGRVGITETSFTADSGQDSFSTAYVPGALLVTLNGIILVNTVDYTATNGSSVILTEAADSGDTLVVTKFGGDSARIQGVVDSSYVQLHATGLDYGLLANTPSLFDSSDALIFIDSNYVQARQGGDVSTFTNDAGYLTDALDSTEAIALIATQGYAPLASPALTGTPTAPTASAATNTTQIATTAYVTTAVNNLIDGAPGTLNTLNEIAAALNDDDSAYATLVNLIGTKSTFDSAEAIQLIDSAHVQLHATGLDYGLLANTPSLFDSADALIFIDSNYVQARQDFAYGSLTGAPTNVSTFTNDAGYLTDALDSTEANQLITSYGYSTFDSAEAIQLIDSNHVQLHATGLDYGLLANTPSLFDSADALIFIDSDYVEARRPPEAIFNVVNNGASAYTFTGDGFSSGEDNPTLYLWRGLTYKFSVNASGHPFQIRVSNGGSAYSTGVTNNGAAVGDILFTPDMNAPETLVYQCTNHSGMVGNIVLLSDTSLLDSSEVIALIATQGYLTDALDSSEAIALIATQGYLTDALDSGEVIALIDSDYIQARQSAGGSAGVTVQEEGVSLATTGTTLNFVGDNVTASGTGATKTITITGGSGTIDSAAVIDLVDSAYVQARQSSSGGSSGGLDSAAVLALTTGARAGAEDYRFTADSGQTAFTGADLSGNTLSFRAGSLQVFLNGILLRETTDYTTSGSSTVTLVEGADSADEVTIYNIAGGAPGRVEISETVFTADSNQSSFAVNYSPGALNVFLNGILLLNGTDYTATSGTSISLTSATDSGDLLVVQDIQGDSARINSVVDSDYVQLHATGLDYGLLSNTPSLFDSSDALNFIDSDYVQARQSSGGGGGGVSTGKAIAMAMIFG